MATTLEQYRAHVRARLGADAETPWTERDEKIMLAAMHQLGWCVANNGEIFNPAPRTVINFPEQRAVYYRGQRRRRGGRR